MVFWRRDAAPRPGTERRPEGVMTLKFMEQRKKRMAKRARDLQREIRDQALTDEERIKRANRKLTRTMRAQQAAADRRLEKEQAGAAARKKRGEQLALQKNAEQVRLLTAAAVLQSNSASAVSTVAQQASDDEDGAMAKTPTIQKRKARPSMASSTRCVPENAVARLMEAGEVNHVPQTVREMTRRVIAPSTLPSRGDIEMSASCCVLCSSVEGGVAYWGNDMGRFACPSTWRPLMRWIEDRYTRAAQAGCTRGVDDDVVQIKHGEYNLVATLKRPEALLAEGIELPALDYERVVLRLTRPDGSERVSPKQVKYALMRYKRRAIMQRELYFQLHASCNGVGLPCEAAFLYPGSLAHDDGTQLYGGFYVLQKAYKDMNKLIEEHTDRVDALPSPSQRVAEQRLAGHRLAARAVQLVHHASALGLVAADIKPGNIVFDDAGAAFIIDFDGCMNSIMRSGSSYAPHVLHNMALLTAHVRGFREHALADGWAAAVKPLMLDLVAVSRGCKWLGEARPGNRAYAELPNDLEKTCACRVEFVSTSYFLRARMAAFNFVMGAKAPPLIVQLVRYGLFGGTGASERDVVWNTWAPMAPAWG